MANERHGTASFPGIPQAAVMSCSYTCSHGITPSVAVLETYPLNANGASPLAFNRVGNLVIADGVGKVVLRDAYLFNHRIDQGEGGQVWYFEIHDRRWRWRNREAVSGHYNQLDPRSKLVPMFVRSPTELALECLRQLGETPGVIDLPVGLSRADVAGLRSIPPITGTNPFTTWSSHPAAEALASLCEQYGRRVVYDPISDAIGIVVPGRGGNLPRGGTSYKRFTTTFAPADRPASIRVEGDPTRFQARFDLEAVGLEWDGQYRPIDELSYTPETTVAEATYHEYELTINNYEDGQSWVLSIDGTEVEPDPADMTSAGDVLTAWAATVNNSEDDPFNKVYIEADGGTATVRGRQPAIRFLVQARVSQSPTEPRSSVSVVLTETAQAASVERTWKYSSPPYFPTVKKTNELTRTQAQDRARQSVFKCYRVTGLDPEVGPYGDGRPRPYMTVPGYGKIKNALQIVLLDSQVDQIRPLARDENVVGRDGQPLVVDYYNGLSRDKAPAVYGRAVQSPYFTGFNLRQVNNRNTEHGTQVYVDFTFEDPLFRVITFAQPVYFQEDGGAIRPAELALQTACHVRDPGTNAPAFFSRVRALPNGNGPPTVARRPDVQLNVTSTYDEKNRLLTHGLLEDDPLRRADYYLDALQVSFLDAHGQTVEYNGIVPVPIDGRIMQVTYEVGPNGAFTTATADGEHSLAVPPYPMRRRREYLEPSAFEVLRRGGSPQKPPQ